MVRQILQFAGTMMSPHFHYKVSSSNHNGFSGLLFISFFISLFPDCREDHYVRQIWCLHFISFTKIYDYFFLCQFFIFPSQHCLGYCQAACSCGFHVLPALWCSFSGCSSKMNPELAAVQVPVGSLSGSSRKVLIKCQHRRAIKLLIE